MYCHQHSVLRYCGRTEVVIICFSIGLFVRKWWAGSSLNPTTNAKAQTLAVMLRPAFYIHCRTIFFLN